MSVYRLSVLMGVSFGKIACRKWKRYNQTVEQDFTNSHSDFTNSFRYICESVLHESVTATDKQIRNRTFILYFFKYYKSSTYGKVKWTCVCTKVHLISTLKDEGKCKTYFLLIGMRKRSKKAAIVTIIRLISHRYTKAKTF